MAERSVAGLARDITSGAVRLAAATAAWLRLVAEFDRREGWHAIGILSCAHWLAWQCGMSPGAAREHVRVARALTGLPLLSVAFTEGWRRITSAVAPVIRPAAKSSSTSMLRSSRTTRPRARLIWRAGRPCTRRRFAACSARQPSSRCWSGGAKCSAWDGAVVARPVRNAACCSAATEAARGRGAPRRASSGCTPTTCAGGCSAVAPTWPAWCCSATSTTGWCRTSTWEWPGGTADSSCSLQTVVGSGERPTSPLPAEVDSCPSPEAPIQMDAFVGVTPIDDARGRRPVVGEVESMGAGQPVRDLRAVTSVDPGTAMSEVLFPDGSPPLPDAMPVNGERMDLRYVVGVLMGNRDLERQLAAEARGEPVLAA